MTAELYEFRTQSDAVYIHTYECDCGIAWRSNRPTANAQETSECPNCEEVTLPSDTDAIGPPHTTGTVVPLHAGMGAPPGQADEDIVHLLEEVLEEAKAGQFLGVAVAGVRHDGSATTGFFHLGGGKTGLAGAIMRLHAKYSASML